MMDGVSPDAAASTGDAALQQTDVLVIGGGPAGSTVATLLARRGHHVTLLEKERHPRFHIGESLLPANLPLLEQLGVAEQVRAIGMQKWGAEFVSPWDGRQQDFRFAEAWDKSMPYAYQVRRSQFDEILIRNAAQAGAHVIEGCRVRSVELQRGARVEARHQDGRRQHWQARYLVDASGRDTFLASNLGVKRRNPRHNSAAIFGHFSGAERNPGERAGHISIYWFDHGWFWFIPLHDGASSIGAVVWPYYLKSRSVPVREFFLATIAQCAPLARRLANATLISEVEATGNYSYSSTRSHGEGYLLLGDAYAFIDPVFSSGVLLAMHSAFVGADAVDACLRTPSRARAALREFDRSLRCGPREYSWFIYRVTTPTMRELLLAPRNLLRMKEAMLSVLAGDIFGSTPIWGSVRAFKLTYALFSLLHARRSVRAARRRSINIRPV
ncbi:MAG TPA: NAD(P)/FAD-dependent oxidoreductase [Steroidobacteraceae bacterium]|jgi:flavin-dependent dehydrogenase|nr:NAD(P)/FAD-dependent oxidoreductase [Steroidobacteraceae bacterium]